MNYLLLSLVSAALICAFATNVIEQNIPQDEQLEDFDLTNARCADVCKPKKFHVTVHCCYQNTFRFIFSRRTVKACLRMRAVAHSNTTRLVFLMNRRVVFNRIVSMSLTKKKVCRRVPGHGRYYAKSHVCLDVDFVDYKKRIVCAKIFGKIRIGWKSFPVDHDFSCFKLPSPSDVDNAVDPLDADDIGTEPSLEENLDLDQDYLGEYDLNPVEGADSADDQEMIVIL